MNEELARYKSLAAQWESVARDANRVCIEAMNERDEALAALARAEAELDDERLDRYGARQ